MIWIDDVVALMDDKEEENKEEEVKDDQVQGRQAKIYKIDMDHASKVLSMQEDEPAEVQEVVDVVTTTKLITEVVTAASETVTAASITIFAAEPQVPTAATTTTAPVRVVAASTRRRKGVVIRDPKEESTTIIPVDTKSKDKGKGIMVEEPKPLKKKQQLEMDEEYARKLHEELNKDIDWDVAIKHVKQKAKEDPAVQRYQTKEQLEEEENRAIQSINETPAQKAAKRRKLNEEVEDLKRHLEIVPDEDDDVYTEATPLARKLYVSFLTLLKNFDREDLESLWSLVKERFSTSMPNNFSDDFLLTTLGAMFERPDRQAQVWTNQRTTHGQAKVKSCKLLESCGVHIITFTTTQLILLVERRYPLSRFTLDQMLNAVRLRVEEQSEMSLELLRGIQKERRDERLRDTYDCYVFVNEASIMYKHLAKTEKPRAIFGASYDLDTKVANLILRNNWTWPDEWANRYPNLFLIPVLLLNSSSGQLVWKDSIGNDKTFSVGIAWDSIRPRGNTMDWIFVVWFGHCIPRHAFHLWIFPEKKKKEAELSKEAENARLRTHPGETLI
nr:hypothetical protein [Tanacetum cinerariifolium]